VFSIKLTAKPDARMVEVPLDIEVELPREFDGAAVLVSSGMPRKVKLRAPKDTIKLSTAYRIDQLVADLVRQILRGQPADVQRAQDAAAAYLKLSRERRKEGAIFLVESDGRGRIEVHEPPAQPAPSASRTNAGGLAAPGAPGLTQLNERISALERSLVALEARLANQGAGPGDPPSEKLVRAVGEQLERRIDQRMSEVEEHLAALNRGETPRQPLTRTSASLPTPGASRQGMRRATAVEAYAEGLRAELKSRCRALLGAAQDRSATLERSFQLALEAERAGLPRLEETATLQKLAGESSARASAISRISDEADLYPAADLPLASTLLERIAHSETPDPLPLLRAVVEASWRGRTLTLEWADKAAQLGGWAVLAPGPGQSVDFGTQELDGNGGHGDSIEQLLVPGFRDGTGALWLPARVRASPQAAEEDLPVIDLESDGFQPLSEGVQPLIESSGPLPSPAEPTAEALHRELQELSQSRIDPLSAEDDLVSAQIVEEPGSAPISQRILSAEILGELSQPIFSAPIVSAEILPDISGPISARVANDEPISVRIPSDEPISAQILEEVAVGPDDVQFDDVELTPASEPPPPLATPPRPVSDVDPAVRAEKPFSNDWTRPPSGSFGGGKKGSR
jgi:hypothetical protein